MQAAKACSRGCTRGLLYPPANKLALAPIGCAALPHTGSLLSPLGKCGQFVVSTYLHFTLLCAELVAASFCLVICDSCSCCLIRVDRPNPRFQFPLFSRCPLWDLWQNISLHCDHHDNHGDHDLQLFSCSLVAGQ